MLYVRYNGDGTWTSWCYMPWYQGWQLLSGTSLIPRFPEPGKHLQKGGFLVDVLWLCPD